MVLTKVFEEKSGPGWGQQEPKQISKLDPTARLMIYTVFMREKGGDGGGERKKEKTDCDSSGSDLGWRELSGMMNPKGPGLTAGSISDLWLWSSFYFLLFEMGFQMPK